MDSQPLIKINPLGCKYVVGYYLPTEENPTISTNTPTKNMYCKRNRAKDDPDYCWQHKLLHSTLRPPPLFVDPVAPDCIPYF